MKTWPWPWLLITCKLNLALGYYMKAWPRPWLLLTCKLNLALGYQHESLTSTLAVILKCKLNLALGYTILTWKPDLDLSYYTYMQAWPRPWQRWRWPWAGGSSDPAHRSIHPRWSHSPEHKEVGNRKSQSTYFTVRGQSYFSRLPKYWLPIPLSARRVCPPPATKAGGTHSPGGAGDRGVNILEDERNRIALIQ